MSLDWQSKIAVSLQKIAPSGIREFFDIVSQREDCVSLGVGEPDFISPRPVLDAAINSIRKGYTHYTGNQGLYSLRKAVSVYLQNEYQLDYDPEKEILITVGVSQGVDLGIRSVLNAGEVVMFNLPSYVSYSPMIELAGGIAEPCLLDPNEDYKISVQKLEETISKQTKILLLNCPSNPTGKNINLEELERLSKFLNEKDILLISDEIYGELNYDRPHQCLASYPGLRDRTLVLGGFSKSFAMTGWRVGYAAGPAPWIQAMTKIHQYSMLCAPTISQFAAEAALKFGLSDRDKMREAFHTRRDYIVQRMTQIGFHCPNPDGAFYIFPALPDLEMDSLSFARRLLDAENVAVVPGTAFGKNGEGHIRCSYASGLNDLKIACDRIERFISKARL
jgi:aminotransferase